jgi:hypothetical protein
MSFYTGTQSEVLFAGPPAAYTAGGATSTAAFNLTAGSTGNYQQPLLPGGFWQQGRNGQLVAWELYLKVTAQASATTLTLVVGLDTAANSISGIATLISLPALTVTSYTAGGIYLSGLIQNYGAGYGTSSVATNLQTSCWYLASGNSTTLQGVVNQTQLATTDFSVNQWFTVQGTFSTSSGTNSAQLVTAVVRGEN